MQREHSLGAGATYGLKPYTYFIYHVPTGMKYYGARYSKNCSPNDLWVTYFTSSKEVHRLIEQYGKDSFRVQVRRIFDTAAAAIKWEGRVLKNINARQRSDFLNKHNNDGLVGLSGDLNPMRNPQHLASWKASTKKTKVGRKLSEEHKNAISCGLKGRIRTLAEREAISRGLKGKERDATYRERCRIQRLGKKCSKESSDKKRVAITGRKKYVYDGVYRYFKPGHQPEGWVAVKNER